jgi:hypothetical protein
MTDEKLNSPLDRTSLATDLVKHVSTLASGSIVLLATFLSRVPTPPDRGILIAGTSLLMLCILCCAVYLGFFGIRRTWVYSSDRVRKTPQNLEALVTFLVFATFCAGIILVGISVVRTLLEPQAVVPHARGFRATGRELSFLIKGF